MKSIEKTEWRERWLSCINELTSLHIQSKSWLDFTHKNPHWTFIEFMCSYFDDLGIDNNYLYQLDKGWISNEEFKIIEKWHITLDKYESPKKDNYDNEAILKDTKWSEIIEIGVKARNELAKTLNETERHILTEEIDYLKYI